MRGTQSLLLLLLLLLLLPLVMEMMITTGWSMRHELPAARLKRWLLLQRQIANAPSLAAVCAW